MRFDKRCDGPDHIIGGIVLVEETVSPSTDGMGQDISLSVTTDEDNRYLRE
jgi:hypothetical protein